MSPLGAVKAAKAAGLDLIGICDHNSAENALAAKKAGAALNLAVLGGMEVASSEEAHILVYFDRDDDLLAFQELVYRRLDGVNDERVFGDQVIADEEDGVTGFCRKLLIGATTIPVEEIVRAARSLDRDSLVIAAHVDREANSLIGQLGFIPPALDLDGLEISARMSPDEARRRFPDCGRYPLITGSDAHEPGEIGRRMTCLTVHEATAAEVRKALAGAGGRKAGC